MFKLNKELRGLIIGLGLGIIYTLLVIYMIIPGLPLSGAFLDHSGERYIDMIFGNNSLFAKGFIFIVTFAFFLIGIPQKKIGYWEYQKRNITIYPI